MIHIFMGPFGSGKTEIAINYAIRLRNESRVVHLVDLDLITPYFRSRDAVRVLKKMGINVLIPPEEIMYADLPLFPRQLGTVFKEDSADVVVDLGGDDDGARILRSLNDRLRGVAKNVYFVINTRRPFYQTPGEIAEYVKNLSNRADVIVDFLVNNTNLGPYTNDHVVHEGEKVMAKASEILGIPIIWTVLWKGLTKQIKTNFPVFYIERFMRLPWEEKGGGVDGKSGGVCRDRYGTV